MKALILVAMMMGLMACSFTGVAMQTPTPTPPPSPGATVYPVFDGDGHLVGIDIKTDQKEGTFKQEICVLQGQVITVNGFGAVAPSDEATMSFYSGKMRVEIGCPEPRDP